MATLVVVRCLFLITICLTSCYIEEFPTPDPAPPPIYHPDPAEESYCGDGICDEDWEDIAVCPLDCTGSCGDGYCSKDYGENMQTCWKDCKPAPYNPSSDKPADQITDPPGY